MDLIDRKYPPKTQTRRTTPRCWGDSPDRARRSGTTTWCTARPFLIHATGFPGLLDGTVTSAYVSSDDVECLIAMRVDGLSSLVHGAGVRRQRQSVKGC